MIRDIKSDMVSRMFVLKGIIISATKPYLKASKLKIQCKKCLTIKTIVLQPGQYPYVPKYCPGLPDSNDKCPKDSFVALPTS
jgi:DNA replicative helicase MCM subunit Mcm2 (Cdc46/Mcm family)